MKKAPTEYEILSDNNNSVTGINNLYKLFGQSLSDNTWKAFDLNKVQSEIESNLNYLVLWKRYCELYIISSSKLYYAPDGFVLDNHVFQTLDEVEKALNHKAFL